MDIYGRCGEKQCGDVRNIQHEYNTNTDPCFHLVNRNYRLFLTIIISHIIS